MRWLNSIIDSTDMDLSKLWETVKDWGDWQLKHNSVTEHNNKNTMFTEHDL